MVKPRVFLTGGDEINWALDEDLRLTRFALDDVVEFSSLDRADVVHSVWWEGLSRIPEESLGGKRVICHASGEPFRYLTHPRFVGIVQEDHL